MAPPPIASPKPPMGPKSPTRSLKPAKSVRFPHYTTANNNDTRSLGAKSAPPMQQHQQRQQQSQPRSDNESDATDEEAHISTDNSSQESGMIFIQFI